MKKGDLIKCKTRYAGQFFIVIEMRNIPTHGHQVRSMRPSDGFKTRWSSAEGWEVLSESR